MKRTLSGLMALLLLLTICVGCGNKNDGVNSSDKNSGDKSSGDEDRSDENGNTPGSLSGKGVYYDITGIDPQEAVLEYDGNSIPAEMYFYWLGYSCSYVEYQIGMLSMYGMYTDLLDEEGNIIWDGDLDGTTPSQYAKESTNSNALSYIVVENMAKEYGVSLTDEDKANMAESLAQQIEQNGGEEAFQQSLKEMGISRETFDRITAAGYLLDHLRELAEDPDGALYEEPDLTNNAYVDHILLMTIDSETREPLSEEEIEAKRTTAEDLLAQLQDAEDVQALFDQLVEEYGDDQGRATDSGYLVDPQTNFVQEFLDATFELEPGELSDIVESSYGYHILLRKELTEEQTASLKESYAGTHVEDLLTERMDAAMEGMVLSEKLDGIDAGEFYNAYVKAMEELRAAETAEDGSEGSSEDGSAE